MHIVFLTNEYPTLHKNHGGIGRFVQTIALKLIQKNVEVSVLGLYPLEKDKFVEENGIKIYGLKQSDWPFAKFFNNRNRLLHTLTEIGLINPIDLVEGFEASFAFFPRNTKYKKIIRLHGGHHFFAHTLGKKTTFWKSYQEKLSFSKADAIIAVSNFVGNRTKELIHFKQPYTTLYNPVNLENFNIFDRVVPIPHTLLFVGTVTEKKGIRELIEAFLKVQKKIPDIILNILGRDSKDQEGNSFIETLKKLIPEQNSHQIQFHGSIPGYDLPKWLAQSELCIYPSHSESFGLTVIEALAMEKPIIVSDIAVFKEIVDTSEARFCSVQNSDDLAKQIEWMLLNPEIAIQMGKKGRYRVLKQYHIDKLIQENLDFYTSVQNSIN